MTETKSTSRRPGGPQSSSKVWTDEERAAMQQSARERKTSARLSPDEQRAQGERDLRESIAKMPPDDGAMAQRIHALVTEAAPSLVPKTYYGMPAYAREGKDGKTICFFKPKSKFKERYSTFGFEAHASLDEGAMWPVAFAVIDLTADVEKRIRDLVKKAAA